MTFRHFGSIINVGSGNKSRNIFEEEFYLKNTNTLSLTKEREHRIGKTTFIVSSFSDESCTRKAADLIMDMLISKVKKKEALV